QGVCWHAAVLRPGPGRAAARRSFGEADMRSAAGQHSVEADLRADTVDWMMSTHQASNLALPAIFLAVQLLDRCLALSQVEPERQLVLGAACLVLAAKFEEYNAPDLSFVAEVAGNQFTVAQVLEMELWALRTRAHCVSVLCTLCARARSRTRERAWPYAGVNLHARSRA
ncbi:unnamed protein product, partial [Prorocentrum cordatum]